LVPTGRPDSIGLGLGRDVSGDSIGYGPKEAPTGLCPKAAWVGEGGAPLVPGEPCTSFGLGGFDVSGTFFLAGGLRGLSIFGDSMSTGALFAEESGFISWGTLHRGSRIKK
jgi:hypothetical protein